MAREYLAQWLVIAFLSCWSHSTQQAPYYQPNSRNLASNMFRSLKGVVLGCPQLPNPECMCIKEGWGTRFHIQCHISEMMSFETLLTSLSHQSLPLATLTITHCAREIGHLRVLPLLHAERVSIHNCGIRSIETYAFARCIWLTNLDLRFNRLTRVGIEFSNLPILEALDLSHNQITNIAEDSFSSSFQLQEIRMAHNNITSCPVLTTSKGYLRIAHIDLSFNGLKRMPVKSFASLIGLQSLNISYNGINTLEKGVFGGASTLTWLDMSFNEIEKLAFGRMPSLKWLFTASNSIEHLPFNSMQNIPAVELLDLSHNRINDLEYHLFDANRRLAVVILNNNRLHHLPSHAFTSSHFIFTLRVDNNYIPAAEIRIWNENEKHLRTRLSKRRDECMIEVGFWIFKEERFATAECARDELLAFAKSIAI